MNLGSKILHNTKLRIVFGLLLLMAFTSQSFAQEARETPEYIAGEKLFTGNCTACHAINKKVVGPPLADVYNKYETEWLYNWIKNPQAFTDTGDKLAIEASAFDASIMTPFAFTNAEIDNVLEYIRVETEEAPPPPPNGEENTKDNADTKPLTIFLWVITGLLLFIMLVMSRITGSLGRLVREKMGELVPEPIGVTKRLFNKKMLAALSIAALVFLGYNTVDSAQKLGRQQGYQPTQPIKFSHALHAGTHQIECQYCHSGASKGKSAVIPSPNVCMNCHKHVQEGPKHGTAEISKIYAAIGWDPVEGEYIEDYEQKPIEWIRIHNLPDHVYFNHAQHVNAGGIECQTCHGAIEEMEVVKQHSSLGMGWCIDCHRKTEVNFEGNDYYSIYHSFHEKLENGEIETVTVEDIGGTECQKCHY